jgi:hypothetical protein
MTADWQRGEEIAMAERVWDEREVPILEAVASFESDGEEDFDQESLAKRAGVPLDKTIQGIRALIDGGYLSAEIAEALGGAVYIYRVRLRAEGRRVVNQWPRGDVADEFLELLDSRIATEDDNAERTRLERLRDGAAGVGREVLTSVLSAWIRAASGLP